MKSTVRKVKSNLLSVYIIRTRWINNINYLIFSVNKLKNTVLISEIVYWRGIHFDEYITQMVLIDTYIDG